MVFIINIVNIDRQYRSSRSYNIGSYISDIIGLISYQICANVLQNLVEILNYDTIYYEIYGLLNPLFKAASHKSWIFLC